MSFQKFFQCFTFSVFLSVGVSFGKEDREKARQAILAEIEKRETALESISKKRAEKQKQRQITRSSALMFEQERESARLNWHEAEEILEMGEDRFQDLLKESKPVAVGVIVKFKEYPPLKEAEILRKLESAGLKEDAKLERLRKWIYKWPYPREISEVEKLCKDIFSFGSVEYCEADVFLPAQSQGNVRDELYREQLERAKQRVKVAEKDVETAQKDVKEAEKEYGQAEGYVQQDQQAVKSAEQDLEFDKQGVERARQNLERAKARNQGVKEAEKRLEDRKKMLSDSEKWLSRMKEQLKKSEKDLVASKKWLSDGKKWLEESKRILKKRQDWLKELESKKPNSQDCSGGQVWDGSACVCPNGESWDGSKCAKPEPQVPECPGGKWDIASKSCVCPNGESWDGSKCAKSEPQKSPCSGGQVWSRYYGKCVCPDSNPKWDGSQCVSASCSAEQKWEVKKSKCVNRCSGKAKWDGSKCVVVCSGGQYVTSANTCACPSKKPKWDGEKCVQADCPGEERWSGAYQKCLCPSKKPKREGEKCVQVSCPAGEIWSHGSQKCRCLGGKLKDGKCVQDKCSGGKYWNMFVGCLCPGNKPKWDGKKCVADPCPGKQLWDQRSGKCVCPYYKPKWDGKKCVADPCPGKQLWDQRSGKCVCPYYKPKWDGKKCVQADCPAGQVWNNFKKSCVCKPGAKECNLCKAGTYWDGKKCAYCRGGKEWKKSVSVCACPTGHIWSGSKCVEPADETANVRACGVLSSNFNLSGEKGGRGQGTLPDYWAQKMIGSDLLKEEIESASRIEKKPFVQLFDSNKQGRHDEFVKNIISGNGGHSVLPELGDGVRTFETNYLSDYSKHTEKLLNDVDKVCAAPPSNKAGDGKR